MTQAQHTHHGTTISTVPLAIAALAMTAVLGIGLAVSDGIPSFGPGPTVHDPDSRIVQMGRDWQAQREAQGGFSDLYTELSRDWQTQQQQIAPVVGPAEGLRRQAPIPAPN